MFDDEPKSNLLQDCLEAVIVFLLFVQKASVRLKMEHVSSYFCNVNDFQIHIIEISI